MSAAGCIVCAHRSPSPRAGFIAGLAYQRAGLVRLCEEHGRLVDQAVAMTRFDAAVAVILDIEGGDHALDVVDNVLDGGAFQDSINEYGADEGPLRVKSCVVRRLVAPTGEQSP